MESLAVMKRVCLSLAVLVTVLISMGTFARLSAQVVGATLSGTISDSSGAVIPDAQISIKNSATGITRAVSTNSDGVYTAPNLLPGDYAVTTSAKGFNAVTTNIKLAVGTQQTLNLKLTVGNVSQSVEVSDVAPTVDLTDSAIGGLNDETTVRELPLNGRSWTDLATLQVGVYAIHTQPAATGPRAASSTPLRNQARTASMAMPMNSCATAHWMREITSTLHKFRPSGGISSEPRREAQFAKTIPLSLATTRAYGSS
jgi:hypothetical protein